MADIRVLEELPGASGRRQSSAYRLGSDRVVKVSPHKSILYEAAVLSYIKQAHPRIPVPGVLGVRILHDDAVAGERGVRFCMLLEYIDGICADEAVADWSVEETHEFAASLQELRRSLAAASDCCIRGIGIVATADSNATGDDDCVMRDASPTDDVDGFSVQDEIFDHIWQTMELGPFASEHALLRAVGKAFERRAAGCERLNLVRRMMDQLPLLSSLPMASPSSPSPSTTALHAMPMPPSRSSSPAAVQQAGQFPLQHANLTLGNILVRRTAQSSVPEIVGVLGWGQAGFYPPWWELAKLAASEEPLLVDVAASDRGLSLYSQHVGVMLHVRDMIY